MITVSKRRGYDQLQFLKVKNLAVWQAYFHGGSTSSNLVGDALIKAKGKRQQSKGLQNLECKALALLYLLGWTRIFINRLGVPCS